MHWLRRSVKLYRRDLQYEAIDVSYIVDIGQLFAECSNLQI